METEFHPRRPKPIEDVMMSAWGEPIVAEDIISPAETRELLAFKNAPPERILKHSVGACKMLGVTLHEDSPLVGRIIEERIRPLLDREFTVRWAWINDICQPLWIHSDTGSDPKLAPYKICLITLDIQPAPAKSHLVLFHQRHTGTAAAFLRGTREHSVFQGPHNNFRNGGKIVGPLHNGRILQVYDPYDFVHFYNEDREFDRDLYQRYLGHLDYSNLRGLTLDRVLETKIGQLVMWDAGQLHCSSQWSSPAIQRKVTLNLFLDHCM